jgi:hypothetical protein
MGGTPALLFADSIRQHPICQLRRLFLPTDLPTNRLKLPRNGSGVRQNGRNKSMKTGDFIAAL